MLLAFLEYQNTPLKCGYSPSQLLLGRRKKSSVPITNKALKPILVNDQKVRKRMQESKQRQKSNIDRSARSLTPLCVNQSVRVKF